MALRPEVPHPGPAHPQQLLPCSVGPHAHPPPSTLSSALKLGRAGDVAARDVEFQLYVQGRTWTFVSVLELKHFFRSGEIRGFDFSLQGETWGQTGSPVGDLPDPEGFRRCWAEAGNRRPFPGHPPTLPGSEGVQG